MRRLAIFSSAFAAAVFLCVYLLRDAVLTGAAAAVIATIVLLAAFRKSRRLAAAALACFGFAVGCLWFQGYDTLIVAPVREEIGLSDSFTVVATDFSADSDYGSSFECRILQQGLFPLKGKVYCDFCSISPGDVLTVQGELRSSESWHGEESDRFTFRGEFFFLYAENVPEKTSSSPGFFFPAFLARTFRERVTELFPQKTCPLFLAILTGDKTELYDDAALLSSFRTAGVYHILVVSGMHMSFLSSVLVFLFGKRKWALVLSVPFLVLFAAVTGFSPSVTRALVMQLFLIGAALTERESDTLTALFASLLLLLCCNPYSAAHAGLQLSFAATLGLVLFTGPLAGRLNGFLSAYTKGRKLLRKISEWAVGILAASLGASVLTVPVACLYYHTVSLAAPVTNLFTILAFTGAFMGGMLACLFSVLWLPLGKMIAYPASWLMQYAVFMTKGIAKFPMASVSTEHTAVWSWLLAVYVTLALFLIFRKKRRCFLLPAACLLIWICAFSLFQSLCGSNGSLTASVLDVGQGQSVLFTAYGHTVLYDCGSSDRTDSGATAANAVKAKANGRLALVIFSHFDRDHVCGFQELAAQIPIGAVLVPSGTQQENEMVRLVHSACAQYEIPCYEVSQNMAFSLGNAEFTLFAPVGEDHCLGLLASEGETDFLLTGDMGTEDEIGLLRTNSLPDIEVFVVGHHGSKYSACDTFLQETQPEIGLISVGYNTFGHPAGETLSRLEQYGVTVYRTDRDGTITISAEGVEEYQYG